MHQRKNKHYAIQVISLSTIGAIFGGWYFFFQREFTPVLKEPIVIEYGQKEITKEDILEEVKENEPIKLVETQDYQEDTIGEHEIKLTLKKGMRQQERVIPIEVKDTQPPIVNVVQPEITIPKDDETLEVDDNIVEIKDPVDGEIENIQRGTLAECNMFLRNRMMKTDCVFIGTDFDVHVAGDYEVKIVSYDGSGNLTVRSFTIHVNDVSDKLARSMPMNEDVKLQENESLYSTNFDPEYIPLSYLFGEQTTYQNKEDAEKVINKAKENGEVYHILTIQGILNNSGISQAYYVLEKVEETKLLEEEPVLDKETNCTEDSSKQEETIPSNTIQAEEKTEIDLPLK